MIRRPPTEVRKPTHEHTPLPDASAARGVLLAVLGIAVAGAASAQTGVSPSSDMSALRGSVANLSITNTASTPTAASGQPLTYTIVVTNAGTNPGINTLLATATPAGTTFASLTSPGAWGCTTPADGGTGTVTCTNAAFAVGSATFALTVTVDPVPPSTITSTANVTSDTTDTNPNDNTATASTSTPVALQSFQID